MLAVAAGSEQLTRAMRSLEAAFLIGVEGVTEILLIRHADCYEDLAEAGDPPLSKLGRGQAARLAERLRRTKLACVYASPYLRAMETAKTFSGEVHVDERLVEMKLEVTDDGSMELREPQTAVVERMRAVVDEITERYAGQRVAVVGHGGAITAYLTDVLRLDPGLFRFLPFYTSISVVRALGDRRMVGALGDVAHLE
jgi:2,3-bisphosphoglycerate-dependent phosphoglycerate mutase